MFMPICLFVFQVKETHARHRDDIGQQSQQSTEGNFPFGAVSSAVLRVTYYPHYHVAFSYERAS